MPVSSFGNGNVMKTLTTNHVAETGFVTVTV
jgi:hypothetical protein